MNASAACDETIPTAALGRATAVWRATWIPAAVISLCVGCASPTPSAIVSAAPAAFESPAGRHSVITDTPPAADLGVVALICSPANAEFRLEAIPLTRGEASAAGSTRATDEFKKDKIGDPGGAIILLPAAWGAAALGGAISGAFNGADGEQIKKAAAKLTHASADLALVDRLTKTFLAHATNLSALSVEHAIGEFPLEPPPTRTRLRAGPSGMIERGTAPLPSHPLAERAVDTIVVLQASHGLVGERSSNPPQVLHVSVRVKLFRTRDWAPLGELDAWCTSAPRQFVEWAAEDAKPLRQEWEIAFKCIEEKLSAWLARSRSGTRRD